MKKKIAIVDKLDALAEDASQVGLVDGEIALLLFGKDEECSGFTYGEEEDIVSMIVAAMVENKDARHLLLSAVEAYKAINGKLGN